MATERKIRVLIVDDTPIVRKLMVRMLGEDPVISVAGTASDPYEAARLIAREVPDVITLDIEMPRMNGLTFLRKLMNQYPVPVVIVSSFLAQNRELGIKALSLGAAGIVTKPVSGKPEEMEHFRIQLLEAVRAASAQNMSVLRMLKKRLRISERTYLNVMAVKPGMEKLILIGASTGGTELIATMLKSVRADLPPVLIVQHMPGEFTGIFAQRLNSESTLTVKEAEKNEILENGHVYIANGFYHLVVRKMANYYVCDLKDGELVNLHRPSVDVLFHSAADFASENVMAILLTGMGTDGAKGLLELKNKGAVCIAQDEKSCVVYGMPKEAVLLKAVNLIGTPEKIIEWMNNFV
ncbi:MAG: chemotaxis response regulator protein-glutamate methylesterase [Mangrovibacterium sp.]|nr:chemotaxis response regulator protein-glutamate methylesterase [Mangrovibacterium sp.]